MGSMTRRQALSLAGGVVLAAPFVRRARAEDKQLNIYNWADYVGETTIDDFMSRTGIEVTYDTYTSAEEMTAKMLAGKAGYDVVNMAGTDMPRFIAAGICDKLDRARLPNWGNLDPEVVRIFGGWDPGCEHAMPYMWGSVGFTVNVDMVRERLPDADFSSLDFLFKPGNAEKLADCGISILDSPTDIFPIMLRYLGKDGDTQNVADYQAVVEAFKPIRPHIRTFDNANYLNAIPNGELCVINSWSGDYATAKARAAEAGIEINLAYYVPATGVPAWCDGLTIPVDAAHKEAAYAFINYMLEPEVVAKCTNYVHYANANAASRPFIDKAILEDPAIYPDEAIIKRMWAPKPWNDEQTRAMTRAWTEIKTS